MYRDGPIIFMKNDFQNTTKISKTLLITVHQVYNYMLVNVYHSILDVKIKPFLQKAYTSCLHEHIYHTSVKSLLTAYMQFVAIGTLQITL